MRIVSAIDRPLADEHVIGVDPPLKPALDGVWRRRINPFAGRSLSDRALTAEQDTRAGIQRLRGQSVTAGIVSGLDLLLEHGAQGAAPDSARFQLLPGFGLGQSGEDIVVSSPRRIALGKIPVYARVDQLDAIAAGGAAPPDPANAPAGPDGLRPLLPRRIGPALGSLIAAPAAAALPRVAVLIAEPVTAAILGRPQDDCPPDPRDDPYDDLERIDGTRLLLAFWPSEQVGGGMRPDYALPADGPDRRNRLAYRIFNIERGMRPSDIHPWETIGLPVALVAFNPDWTLDFVDRASVVRLGGQPNPRTPLVPQSGSPLLWQARVAQFAEHLSELDELTVTALTQTFRQLPPIGFLPATVIDLRTRRQEFFPAGFSLSAVPVPIEHLDAAVRDSAALSPINLDVPDEIELLVPVPERVYEPGLLETATVDGAFARAAARYVADRTQWLTRRELLSRRRDLLIDTVTGQRPAAPASALPPAEALPYPAERAPVTATRVRRMAAGAGLRSLHLLGSASALPFVKGDRAVLWVRIVDANGLTGFSLCFGVDTSVASKTFAYGVFWGAENGLPLAAGDPNIKLRGQGALPPAGLWTRLEVLADARWTAAGGALAPADVDGVELAQLGGTIEWGPIGKVDEAGNETVWIADDAPPGSILRDGVSGAEGWPQASAGLDDVPSESDVGTSETGGVRSVIAVARLRERWSQDFLASEFMELEDRGIDALLNSVEAKLKATNDAIDLGFVRARSDIYRVRQYMLGGDAASRLATSPALADIALREESARAKGVDLAAFVKTAYQTDFLRDPNEPLETKPKRPPGAPVPPAAPPAAPPAGGGGSSLFFNSVRVSAFSTLTAPAPTRPAVTAMAVAPMAVTAQPMMVATPLVFATQPGISAAAATPTIATLQSTTALSRVSLAGLQAELAPRREFNARDIQAQLPLPGVVERTLSVAERLKPSPAVEAHGYAIAGKYAVVNVIAGLLGDGAGSRPKGIALGDLPAPGFHYKPDGNPEAPRRKDTIGDVILDRNIHSSDKREYEDLDERKQADQRHEADYFTAAVNAIDNSIALMRLVEGRVDLYNQLVADIRDVRRQLLGYVAEAAARLRIIEVEVEEARHDVAVAAALLAEERERVDSLNARRAAILEANVKSIVFRRGRRADRIRAVPFAPAAAALADPPTAICLREHPAVPEELHDYATLFRDAPVAWFPAIKARLDLIDRLDAARSALVAVRLRAATPFQLVTAPASNPPKLLAAVHKVIGAQRVVFDQRRVQALQLDVAAAAATEIGAARIAIAERASLADLIAGDHNRPQLARLAAAEIEGLGQVGACLHDRFGEAPPSTRLKWAELLSEFDSPAPLSQLAGLPGWNRLPIDLRRAQQGLVDWLFSRIDRSIAPAESAINELVRICLLLAAHAPIERIIPARLVAPAPARIGARLDLAIDLRHVRVGMTALVRGPDAKPIAHAIVDDLAEGIARAKIVKLFSATSTIAAGVRIELSDTRMR